MKNLKIAIAFLMLIGFATIGSAAEPETTSLQKKIRKCMTYPEFALDKKMDGLVLVEYTVMDNGHIHVGSMNATNAELAGYVKKCLEEMEIEDTAATGIHHAKFTFRFE